MASRASNDTGFTLVEMLIVLSIVSVLVLMAAVSLSDGSTRAYIAAMQSDLHTIMTAQEAYYEETFVQTGAGTYAGDVTDLDVNLSPGVSVRLRADQSGWTGRSTHSRVAGKRCAVFKGPITPLAPATAEGTIACD